jgi:hypothetical protein
MKNFTLIFSILFCISVSFSQVQNYSYSISSGTYTPITGGTVLQSGTFDAFNSLAINFSFRYNCIQVSSLKVNADGHIGLGNYISTANYTPLSGSINASIGILSAMGRDLASSDEGSPEIRYEIIGDEFIAQWTDVRRSGTSGERINFQIRINTVTNVINYVYGPYISGVANTNYPEIGLKGNNNIFPTNVKNIILTCGATGWLGVTAGTANNSKVCLSNATFPASGTTFTWNPPSPATPDAIVGTATQCPGATSQTYSITADPNATTYTWTVPTGWTITAGQGTESVTVTAGTAGQNGDISVTATDLCGTSAASILPVTVGNAAPSAPGIIAGTETQCPGAIGQTFLIAAVANTTNYTWTVPTGWTITAGQGTESITVTAGTAGENGNITVTAENLCGTSSASTLAVTVGNAAPSTPGTIAGNASLCAGGTNETYSVTAVANAITYSWTVPTGWTISSGAGTNSIIVLPGTAGQNGLISVTAGNECGTSQASTLQVAVNPLPSVNAGSDTTVCIIDLPISISATGNATSYSWNTGASNATTTITTAGTYTVTGTLNGCSSTDNIMITTDPCAGIEENQQFSFQLYPNPSNSVIHITSNSQESVDYSVYSIEGKLMLEGLMNNGAIAIIVDHFAPGKYFTKMGAKVIAFEVVP